jgi:hypothetical protein
MAIARRKPDPDGITTARLAGTASRHASRQPLDVDAALAELREIAHGRGDLLAERAGVILAFHDEDARDSRAPDLGKCGPAHTWRTCQAGHSAASRHVLRRG